MTCFSLSVATPRPAGPQPRDGLRRARPGAAALDGKDRGLAARRRSLKRRSRLVLEAAPCSVTNDARGRLLGRPPPALSQRRANHGRSLSWGAPIWPPNPPALS